MSASRIRRVSAHSILFSFSIFGLCSSAALADTISAPGMSAPGTLVYDSLGMPTITAATDNDAAFLQGYAQAKARFFEMDFNRRAISGTLAALVGQSALANDVQSRTLGLRRAALASWQAMDDDTRGWLQAYANGVNYWLQTTPSLPLEYQGLSLTKADPWVPLDTISIGKGLAYQLSFDSSKVQNTINFAAYQQAAAAAKVDPIALYFGDTHRFAPPDSTVTIPGFQPGATNGTAIAAALQAAAPPTAAPPAPISAQTLKLAQGWLAKVANHPLIAPTLRSRA